ncbi:hypothetical protein [Luteolibacter sp. Populi]|uniref:hypothetical protein n=1 Tax=Luteolibacter sp. Populi TaxID=3230487 RepID=UPI0034652E0B
MKSAIIIPVLVTAIAAGVWLAGSEHGQEPAESRPAKSGRDSERAFVLETALPETAEIVARVNEDPEAAVAWAMERDGVARDQVLSVIVVETAVREPARAVKRAEEIADPKLRGESLGFAAAQWASVDADAAFAWLARGGEDEAVRGVIERTVFPALAEVDPVRVAEWLSEGKVSPGAMDAAVAATVQRWTQRDAPAAAEWVASFADEQLLKAAVEPLVSLWARQDRAGATRWIEGLPAGVAREEACAAYVAALAVIAPEEAKEWVGKARGEGTY